jgi:hypothetical protein
MWQQGFLESNLFTRLKFAKKYFDILQLTLLSDDLIKERQRYF